MTIIIMTHTWLVENQEQKLVCVGQVFNSSTITRHSLNQTQGEPREEMGEIVQKNSSWILQLYAGPPKKQNIAPSCLLHFSGPQ